MSRKKTALRLSVVATLSALSTLALAACDKGPEAPPPPGAGTEPPHGNPPSQSMHKNPPGTPDHTGPHSNPPPPAGSGASSATPSSNPPPPAAKLVNSIYTKQQPPKRSSPRYFWLDRNNATSSSAAR